MLIHLILLSTLAFRIAAWGEQGHETVGYIAQAFLTSSAASFVNQYLDPYYGGSLGLAAPWADEVRRKHGYTWSAPYHFVDANDSPTSGSCSVDEARDCKADGCILTAIANYTSRVQDSTLEDSQRDEALKFLTHFFGDITQPLHDEAYERGANEIFVQFNGRRENLHAVWDDYIIQLNLKQNFGGDVQSYASSLVQRIKSEDFANAAPLWVSCIQSSIGKHSMDLLVFQGREVDSSSTTPLDCPIEWAKDANAYDCSYIFDYEEGQDLVQDCDYYTNAVPIIDLQLAKGGYRLATWLNTIFADTSVESLS